MTPQHRPVDFDPFQLEHVAAEGNGDDRYLAHVSKDDLVIPFEHVTPEIKQIYHMIMGKQAERFTVGSPANSINKKTGLIQFDSEGGGEGPGAEGGGSGPGMGADHGDASDTSGGGGTAESPSLSSQGVSPGVSQGDKSAGSKGSGGGSQTDTGPGGSQEGGTGQPGGGEIGTGHGLGASIGGKGFGGGLPDPGLPEGATAFTGINMLDRSINQAVAHPAATAINAAFSAVPIAGQINTALGLMNTLGITDNAPTAGSIATGAIGSLTGGQGATTGQGQGTGQGSGQSSGGSAGPSQPNLLGGPINSLTTTQALQQSQGTLSAASVNPILQNLLINGASTNPFDDQKRPAQVGNPYISGNQGITA